MSETEETSFASGTRVPLLTREVRAIVDWTVELLRRDVVELSALGHPAPRLGDRAGEGLCR